MNHPKNGQTTSFDFDFSLLELSEPLQFNDKVQPVALPEEDLEVPDGSMCEISGWGKDQEKNSRQFELFNNLINKSTHF